MPGKKTPKPQAGLPDLEARIAELKKDRQRILIRLVTTIARTCTMHGTKATHTFGLGISQVIVLGELFARNGCRQEDLRERVALDKGNVTRALQRLEETGLVQRKQDDVDRRVTRVYVTRKALAIEAKMFALAALWDDQLTKGFTPEEREIVISLLQRMETNARAMGEHETPSV